MKLVYEITLSRHIPRYLQRFIEYIVPTKGYLFEENEFTTFVSECRKMVSRQYSAQRNALLLTDSHDSGSGNIVVSSVDSARHDNYVRIKYIDIKGSISFSPNKRMHIEPYLL